MNHFFATEDRIVDAELSESIQSYLHTWDDQDGFDHDDMWATLMAITEDRIEELEPVRDVETHRKLWCKLWSEACTQATEYLRDRSRSLAIMSAR